MSPGERALALLAELVDAGDWYPSAVELNYREPGRNGQLYLAEAEAILDDADAEAKTLTDGAASK